MSAARVRGTRSKEQGKSEGESQSLDHEIVQKIVHCLANGLDMNEERKRGIRDVYWDLGLRIRWPKIPFTLRKHRESRNVQFLMRVKTFVAGGTGVGGESGLFWVC